VTVQNQDVQRILVLNVGLPSEQEPETRSEMYAIERTQPHHVVFVCSEASRALVREYIRLANLGPERHEVLTLEDPDDLVLVYEQVSAALHRLRSRWPEASVVVDYTAGTKSMSCATAMAAVDCEDDKVTLRLVHGQRGEGSTVVPGTETHRPVQRIHDIRARRRLASLRGALARYDYVAAGAGIEEIICSDVSSQLAERCRPIRDLCRAFDAWDRWELQTARQLFTAYRSYPAGRQPAFERLTVLEQLAVVAEAARGGADLAAARDPYVAVEDLLLNAERRATQGRYDDAVARVYRALELLAQLRLRIAYGVDTADVDPGKLPEQARGRIDGDPEGEPRKLGLWRAWEVLAAYPNEPLAAWFAESRDRLWDFLAVRNQSILAHGVTAVSRREWEGKGQAALDLCRVALQRLSEAKVRKPLRHMQFPRDELLDGVSDGA